MSNTILRRHRVPRYVAIPPELLMDKKLTFKAKGLYCQVMALPEYKRDKTPYDFSVNGLLTQCKEGKDAVYSALKELKEAGWITVCQEKGDDGKFGCTYYDFLPSPNMTKEDEPCEGLPFTDFPDAEKPNAEKPTQNYNIIKSNSNANNSSSSRVREGFVSKGNMPEMEQGWMDELRMFIRRIKQVELTEIQVMRYYLDFKAQMTAQWTDEHEELFSEWRQHFTNYLRKAVEIEGKRGGDTTTNTTLKGNYNAGVEATNKMLETQKAKNPIVGEALVRWSKAHFAVDENNNPIDTDGNIIQ